MSGEKERPQQQTLDLFAERIDRATRCGRSGREDAAADPPGYAPAPENGDACTEERTANAKEGSVTRHSR